MCTADVVAGAEPLLADLLLELRRRLADQFGVDPDTITVGPVDLGT